MCLVFCVIQSRVTGRVLCLSRIVETASQGGDANKSRFALAGALVGSQGLLAPVKKVMVKLSVQKGRQQVWD